MGHFRGALAFFNFHSDRQKKKKTGSCRGFKFGLNANAVRGATMATVVVVVVGTRDYFRHRRDEKKRNPTEKRNYLGNLCGVSFSLFFFFAQMTMDVKKKENLLPFFWTA